MLSNKLVESIEDHSEPLMALVVERIRLDPDLSTISQLRDLELREAGYEFLHKLGSWLAGDKRDDVASQQQEIGKLRYSQQIPLHECVKALHILKYETVDYVRNQGFAQTSLEIYAEEELEHRLNRFMDFQVYHLVRGYEAALRKAARKMQDAVSR
jgi:hypothetical protein